MRRFWTADYHLGHYSKNGGIIKYCNRPFKDLHHMNARLITEANMRVKEDDVSVHVGDFCARGGASKFKMWRSQLIGNWVFLKGNHDSNNGVKTVGTSMFTRLSHFHVFVSHIPFYYEDWFEPELRAYVAKFCDFAICGHVHEKWRHQVKGIPVINVGVDVQNFRPVSDDEVVGQYLKIKREMGK